jgi:uncharacterized damage-inducible protein DinB
MSTTEPWLRGPISGVHPIAFPFLYSMAQVREDLDRWTAGLTPDQLWARPRGLGAIGFHYRHVGGSTERLATYLSGHPLSEDQMREMKEESEPGVSLDELRTRFEERLLYAEAIVKALDPRTWHDARAVGRKALPTTVGGLVHHIAEHAQRHVGEIIVTAKIVRAGL